MSNAPLLLADNLAENVILHPTFTLVNTSYDTAAGMDVSHVADNLRDLTSWTPSTSNASRTLLIDTQTSAAANMIILDRGHNLAGATVTLATYTYTGGNYVQSQTLAMTIPSVVGGLPTDANGCLTPDGVWWKTFTSLAAQRAWGLILPALGAGVAPVITGWYLGQSYRFPAYLNTPFADDYRTDVKNTNARLSRGGVRVLPRRVNFRKVRLSVDLESTDYPAFDAQVRPLLRYGQPWWVCLDDSDATLSGLLAPFQVAGDVTYEPAANPVHRELRSLELEEVMPRLWV